MTEMNALDELAMSRSAYLSSDKAYVGIEQVRGLLDNVYRALADKDLLIADLRTQLDESAGRMVHLCMDRDIAMMQASSGDVPEGSVLRTTDTGREFRREGGTWTEQSP